MKEAQAELKAYRSACELQGMVANQRHMHVKVPSRPLLRPAPESEARCQAQFIQHPSQINLPVLQRVISVPSCFAPAGHHPAGQPEDATT